MFAFKNKYFLIIESIKDINLRNIKLINKYTIIYRNKGIIENIIIDIDFGSEKHYENFVEIINKDKSQAIFAYNSVKETKRTTPPKYRFSGLSAEKIYTLTLIWPIKLKEYSPSILGKIQGEKFSGESLMQLGMQLPVLFPQTSLIFELIET